MVISLDLQVHQKVCQVALRNVIVSVPEGKDILIPVFNTVCAEITDAGIIRQEFGLEEDEDIPPSQLKEGLVAHRFFC